MIEQHFYLLQYISKIMPSHCGSVHNGVNECHEVVWISLEDTATFSGLSIFQYFQVYQYFTIYRQYFLLKFEQFSWISYTTLFKISRYQRPFLAGKSTWYCPLLRYLPSKFLINLCWHLRDLLGLVSIRVVVFGATFNNISIILWWSVLLVEERGAPGETRWPAICHWQSWSHNVVLSIRGYASPEWEPNSR